MKSLLTTTKLGGSKQPGWLATDLWHHPHADSNAQWICSLSSAACHWCKASSLSCRCRGAAAPDTVALRHRRSLQTSSTMPSSSPARRGCMSAGASFQCRPTASSGRSHSEVWSQRQCCWRLHCETAAGRHWLTALDDYEHPPLLSYTRTHNSYHNAHDSSPHVGPGV